MLTQHSEIVRFLYVDNKKHIYHSVLEKAKLVIYQPRFLFFIFIPFNDVVESCRTLLLSNCI